MKKKTLEKYRKTLLEMRPQLREEIEHLVNLLPEEMIAPGDDWDEPSEVFDAELEAEHSQESLFRQVNAALERIEEGTYGTCVECGRIITAARLKAVPYTACCIDCERRLEAQ